ncbi:hypothetical protein GGX14DRAFT_396501 [Mycena pura]|uniref:Uncharacterized protein n=1 Tax=Mycena pura TaxID=153505 RepID=A0AAD6Y8D6_9AGAR|nr:hypothetical protein GGX14DRAFT_396501 [Mycena pura]
MQMAWRREMGSTPPAHVHAHTPSHLLPQVSSSSHSHAQPAWGLCRGAGDGRGHAEGAGGVQRVWAACSRQERCAEGAGDTQTAWGLRRGQAPCRWRQQQRTRAARGRRGGRADGTGSQRADGAGADVQTRTARMTCKRRGGACSRRGGCADDSTGGVQGATRRWQTAQGEFSQRGGRAAGVGGVQTVQGACRGRGRRANGAGDVQMARVT